MASNQNHTKHDIFLFLLPSLGLLKINFIGELYLLELLLLTYFLFRIINKHCLLTDKLTITLLSFILLWLAFQILTDWIRNIDAVDYLRGWAKIIFFMISYAALMMLLDDPRKIILWFMGSAIPELIRPIQLFGGDESFYILWKFGIGHSILIIFCTPLIASFYNKPNNHSPIVAMAIVLMVFGGLSFIFNARSMAGISIVSGLIVLVFYIKRFHVIRKRNIALGILLIAILANGLSFIYSFGASGGYFGDEARDKYESQVVYGDGLINIISGGRPEAFVSIMAVSDSPIIGHGSWARNYEYIKILLDIRKNYSEVNENEIYSANDGLIPSHSYLMGAWVEAGIAGGWFWLIVIVIAIFYALPAAFYVGNFLGLVFVANIIYYLWNIIFSPFGANVRVDVAWFLVLCSNINMLRILKMRSVS